MGYDAATFQEIAVRADLTRPAINHYYPSKHSLYQHVVDETNAAVIAESLEEAKREETFHGRIRAFLQSAVRAKDYDRSAAAFLVTSVLESQRHPELSQHDNDSLHHVRSFAAAALRDGIATGELRADIDAEAATEMLVAAFWGLGFYAGFVGDQGRLDRMTDEFMSLFGTGGWLTNE